MSNEEGKEDNDVNQDENEKDDRNEKLDTAPPPTTEELQQAAILAGMEGMKRCTRRILPLIHNLQREATALAEVADRFTLRGESPIESVHIFHGLLEVKKAYHALDLEVARLN